MMNRPLRIQMDASQTVQSVVAELIKVAESRQRESGGAMVADVVLQHLVGAKIQLALPGVELNYRGFSVADGPSGSQGDFLVKDTVVHVTTAPSEALIRKCVRNLESNLRPLIITTESGLVGAKFIAGIQEAARRIEVLEVGQFIATTVFRSNGFDLTKSQAYLRQLIDTYNGIIERCESDHSLRIELD
ncbi:MAG: DUF4928 domain-containing protein [Puniceicoccaceae bacterium]|nr:MAG: DUF4928 domain-containing protein [Puniceicoccaceae bacterium]